MAKKRIFRILKWFFGSIAALFLIISLVLYIFKDDICQMAIDAVNENLKAKVEVSSVELTFWSTFPNLSVDFNHVFVRDAVPGATERDTLLYTDLIRCKVNPFDIWREDYKVKTLEIHPGVLNLRVDKEGGNNYDILKESDSKSESAFKMELKEVLFTNFRFTYSNEATGQVYSTRINEMTLNGDLNEDVFTATATSDLQIVAAQSGNLTLVSNKPAKLGVQVKVNSKEGTVVIPRSTISVAKLPFFFEGNVDSLGFAFKLSGKNIGIEDAANNLAMKETKDIKDFSGSGTLLFDLDVVGKNEATTPVVVNCAFGVTDGMLRDPNSGITLKKLSLEGKYSNEGGANKEFLELKNVGFVSDGGPFKGRLKITKFIEPNFEGNANGVVDLAVVRSLFKLNSLKRLDGTVDVSSQFEVLTKYDENHFASYNVKKCQGELVLHEVNAQLVEDKRTYRDIVGKIYLRNDKIGLEGIQLNIGDSDFALDGVFSHLTEYLSHQGSLQADVSIKSRRVDLEDLGSDSKEEIMQQQREFILPNDIQGSVYVDVDKLKYEKHLFYDLRGNMSLLERKIHFPKLTVRNGGADASGTVTITEDRPEIFMISSQIVSNNIHFDKLFAEWDDFNQDVIKSGNISGVAKANIRFEAPFDLRSGIISKAIVANVSIQINNGRLKNVQTFKEITKSLKETPSARIAIGKENINAFEDKLLDLSFETLENNLIIRDGILTIPLMSIKSSALDLEVSGKHSFDNKIDYRFGFRFRDLKQPKQSEFGTIIDDGTGKHVFMRMYGDLDNPIMEWDAESSKEHKLEQREQAKDDARSIFKSEFGLFKNDTTVKTYVKERRPVAEFEVILNGTEDNEETIEQLKPKKNNFVNRNLEKFKKEAENENKEIFEIEF